MCNVGRRCTCSGETMSDFPDEHQRKVIEHRGRPLVVVAGPGSGKTRTLVERARAILASDSKLNVAFVTFTRTSRRDTKKKLDSVLSADQSTRGQDFPRVSTLHGFAKGIVHKAPSTVGLNHSFSVLVVPFPRLGSAGSPLRPLA